MPEWKSFKIHKIIIVTTDISSTVAPHFIKFLLQKTELLKLLAITLEMLQNLLRNVFLI